mmetsp:Transcript_54017/g.149782  ORF Transcript_54017/g.149782 Transcript_54017/m.149782 type:complete len:307 (+) Transcript_54017:327-1247(+)
MGGLDLARRGRPCDASGAALRAEHEALVPRVLAEVVVRVVVQLGATQEAGRQPDRQEVLLAVAPPDASAPRPGADATHHPAQRRLHRPVVHRRLVGLVPLTDVLVEVAALGVADVVHQLGVRALAALAPRVAPRAHGRHGHERAGRELHVHAVDGRLHGLVGDVLVEPVHAAQLAAAGEVGRASARLPVEVAEVPASPQQREGHGQHAFVGVAAAGEEGKRKHLAVELHGGLILAVGHLAELRPAAHEAAGDVGHRLEGRAAGHEVREAAGPLAGAIDAERGGMEGVVGEPLPPGGVVQRQGRRRH